MSDDPKGKKGGGFDPNVSGEWNPQGPSLDADGRVVGAKPASAKPPPNAPVQPEDKDPSGLPKLASLKTGDLELMHDPASHARPQYEERNYRDGAVDVRSRKGPMLAVLALVLLGAGGFFLVYKSPRLQASLNARTPKGPLVISSDPSGAELWLAGTKVGNTPWAVDNHYVGKTAWEVKLKGYKPKKGTFMGGEETHLTVELEPQ